MQAVQHEHGVAWHVGRASVLTVLAAVLVLVALNVPSDPQALGVGAFLRLPLEALVFFAVVLALPRRLGRVRTVLAVLAGLLLGSSALLRLLDIGFVTALDRPFDTLTDWRYTGSLLSLVQDSYGEQVGAALVAAGVLVALVLLVLLPLSVVRLTRGAVRHREGAARALAVAASLWVGLAVLDVHAGGVPVAAHTTGPVRLRADHTDRARARGPARVRGGGRGGGTSTGGAAARAAGRAARQGRPARLRRELRTRGPREPHGRPGCRRGAEPGVAGARSRGLLEPQRLAHLPDVRRHQLAGPRDVAVRPLDRQPATLRPPGQQRPDDAQPVLRQGRVAHRGGRPGQQPGLAAGRDLRLRPHLRLAEHRLRGSDVRYPTMPDQFTLEAFHRLKSSPASAAGP